MKAPSSIEKPTQQPFEQLYRGLKQDLLLLGLQQGKPRPLSFDCSGLQNLKEVLTKKAA